MGVDAGLWAGDPLAGGIRGGDASVQGGGQLEYHPGQPSATVLEVGGEQLGRLCGPHSYFDCYPSLSERSDALTRNRGIGILDGHNHPSDPRGDNGLATRPGAALVVAGLQRGVEIGALSPLASRFQSIDLGMVATRHRRSPHALVFASVDHAPHPRVGGGHQPAGAGGLQGQIHHLIWSTRA